MADTNYIWMDGELLPEDQANVPFMTPALHYGLAVFEGIRCYATSGGPAVFRLREHMQRLVDSIKILGVEELDYSLDDLVEAVKVTIRANHLTGCYIRPLIYMADGPLGLNLDTSRAAIGISAWKWGAYLGEEATENGVRMMVSSYTRHHVNVMMTKAKITGNYANSVMAKTLALRSGYEEAVMLDAQGFVAECTGENLFVIRDATIYTPPRTTVLEGITRESVITLARDLGYEVVEEQITRDQLYIADEVFVCGTAAEVVAVNSLDTRVIANGKMGPITRKLQKVYYHTVRGEGDRSAEWCDLVPEGVSL
jgi:branched-chain amino acid aminotransferase